MRLLRGPNIERRGWLLVCDGLHLVHECLLVAVPFLGRRRQLIKGQKALRKDLFLRSCTQTTPGLCYQCPRSDRVFCWVHLQVRARGSLGERTMAILPEPAVPRPSFACTCEVEMSMEHSYPSVWHQSAPISTNQQYRHRTRSAWCVLTRGGCGRRVPSVNLMLVERPTQSAYGC